MNKKQPFRSNIEIAGGDHIPMDQLRSLAKAEPEAFFRKMQAEVDGGLMSFGQVRDLPGLWRALADVQVSVAINDELNGRRTMMASAFPVFTGILAVNQINTAYAAVPGIVDRLVTDLPPDARDESLFARPKRMPDNDPSTINTPSQEYPEIGATEEKAWIGHNNNGRRLSFHKKMISQNDVAGMVLRLNALGEWLAEFREERGLKRITDHDGSAASGSDPVYRPGTGAGTALFSATANTPGTRAPSGTRVTNNALVTHANFETARKRLTTMRNDAGKRMYIPWSECVILVPDALVGAACAILTAERIPGSANNDINPFGPRGNFAKPVSAVISSPKLDDLSTTAWYVGIPTRQMFRKTAAAMEVITLGEQTESYLRQDIVFQMRVSEDTEIGALDYVYWVQCLSGTTAPKDA